MPPVVCAFLPAVVSAVLALLSLARVSTKELVFWRALSDFSCEWMSVSTKMFRSASLAYTALVQSTLELLGSVFS